MKYIVFIISFLLQLSNVYGQDNFKEIKSLTNKLHYANGAKIYVSGERTFIHIETWNEPFIEADIEIISRYTDKQQAKRDLEVINIVFENNGNDIFYSNAIQLDDIKEKPKSNLKTILHLKVPEYAILDIKNSFGELTINGKIFTMNLTSSFCKNSFQDYAGNLIMRSKYDDVSIINGRGKIDIRGNRSDILINKVGGEVDIDLEFGSLEITYNKANLAYNVDAKYTPITIYLSPELDIYHEYNCSNCHLKTENCNEAMKIENIKKKESLTIGADDNSAKSTIQSESEDITIISIKPQANY